MSLLMKPPANHRFRSDRKRCSVTVAGLVMIVLLVPGCGWFGDADRQVVFGTEPDPLEHDYQQLAAYLESEKSCFLISHDSVKVAGMGPRGTRAQGLRSRCFHTVANRTGRGELCDHVSSVSTLLAAGHKNDRQRCLDEAAGNPMYGGQVDREAMYRLAGWDEGRVDELMQRHGLPPEGKYCLLYSREFFAAIDGFPNFAGDDDLEQARSVEWQPHRMLQLPGFPCSGRLMDATG
jgi:hypothetical protein